MSLANARLIFLGIGLRLDPRRGKFASLQGTGHGALCERFRLPSLGSYAARTRMGPSRALGMPFERGGKFLRRTRTNFPALALLPGRSAFSNPPVSGKTHDPSILSPRSAFDGHGRSGRMQRLHRVF